MSTSGRNPIPWVTKILEDKYIQYYSSPLTENFTHSKAETWNENIHNIHVSSTLSFFAEPPLAQPPGEKPWNQTHLNFSPAQKCAFPHGRPLQKGGRRGGRDPCWHILPWQDKIKLLGRAAHDHLAKFILCFCPPLRLIPFSPISVESPPASCTRSASRAHVSNTLEWGGNHASFLGIPSCRVCH